MTSEVNKILMDELLRLGTLDSGPNLNLLRFGLHGFFMTGGRSADVAITH